MNKRLLSLFVALNLTTVQLNAIAAVKAGDACKKAGITATAGSKKFTCVKSGKKLVWNKGVSIPKPKPVEVPVPNPTSTPSPATVVAKPPTGFDDLVMNYQGIPDVVWNEAQSLASSGIEKSQFEIEIGPNTSPAPAAKDPSVYLKRISKLWSNYYQPTKTKVFLYNYKDVGWVQQRNRELQGSVHTPETIGSACTSAEDCSSFGGAYNGLGQLYIGVQVKSFDEYSIGFVKGNYGHEYTHTVQYMALNAPANAKLPCWFAEGQPQVPGQSLGFETLPNYLKSRKSWTTRAPGVLGDYSPESILKFYSMTGGSGTGTCNAEFRPRSYDIGYMTVEALAAIKGIQSTMDLVVAVGKGNTFADSFKLVYGITWEEAAPILAKTVSQEFKKL
jgi:hypothetical protein